MTHKCPYCRQAVAEILLPPMRPVEYAIYTAVTESGSKGLTPDQIISAVLKLTGKALKVTRIRIHIHYLNRRRLYSINQRITAAGHYGYYVLTNLREQDSGAAA